MRRRQKLDGKVVFITGAARGIGEQSARLAASRGERAWRWSGSSPSASRRWRPSSGRSTPGSRPT